MNGETSTPAKQQAPLATDTSNEFVYNVCDNQGKLLLSINAHGDVVVNELIARKIHPFGRILASLRLQASRFACRVAIQAMRGRGERRSLSNHIALL